MSKKRLNSMCHCNAKQYCQCVNGENHFTAMSVVELTSRVETRSRVSNH